MSSEPQQSHLIYLGSVFMKMPTLAISHPIRNLKFNNSNNRNNNRSNNRSKITALLFKYSRLKIIHHSILFYVKP